MFRVKEYLAQKREIYREYAKTYDEDRHLMVGEETLSGRMDWALSGLRVGHRLLDLGCGTGDLLLKSSTTLGEDGISYGLDLSPAMLAVAAEKLKGYRVNLIRANVIDSLPFASSPFDLVTSLNLLQELPPSFFLNVLREAYRVLKPGGWFRGAIPCIMGTSEADSAFSLEAERRADMFFRPWHEIDVLFRMSGFEDIEVNLRQSSASKSAARGEPKFKLFTQFMETVRAQGLDPNHIQEPVLLLLGRKGWGKLPR